MGSKKLKMSKNEQLDYGIISKMEYLSVWGNISYIANLLAKPAICIGLTEKTHLMGLFIYWGIYEVN